MKKDLEMEQKIEATLASLDSLRRVEVDPFFYTRLSARFQEEDLSVWGTISGFLTRPLIMALLIVAIIAGNSIVFYKSSHTTVASSSMDRSTEDYTYQAVTYYESETP